MDFVTHSFRFILDRGIMGLGSGILESHDGNQVAVVLPELHDDDNYSNVDLLKEMMSEFTLERDNQFMLRPDLAPRGSPSSKFLKATAGSDQPRGLFNIDFVLAYNPSAPSLYILDTTTIPYDWAQAVVFKTEPIDVTAQIVSFLDGDPRITTRPPLQPANLKNMSWDDFRQTSIRLIVFLSSSSYDSINYQEV